MSDGPSRRVLMTTTAYPPSIGGVQSYVADLSSRLENFTADVVALWLENRTDWLLGTTIRLAPGAPTNGVTTLGWPPGDRLRMAPWALAYYGVIPIAARRIAAIMEPHVERLITPDHVLIHSHRIGREFFAMACLAAARKRSLPFVLTPHHHPKWRGPLYAGWTNVYRSADAVLTVTEAEVAQLVELGVARERIHVVGGGPDDPLPGDAAGFRRRIGAEDRPIVVFVGQLYEYKGVAQLVAAMQDINGAGRRAELVFIGPHTPFSQRYFAGRSRPWLHVLGSVDRQTKWDALEAAAMLCLPSAHEAFGRVYLEAWSKGKAVIGGRIPAVAEVVKDGQTGLLVDPASIPQLVHALDGLLSNPQLGARLGEAGRHELERRFTWKSVVARVEQVYEQLLARRATAGQPT
jgi:glycosyltransferase involved in cell wall biosynthesis